jgi:16S rRNA processing protein RimM
VASTNDRIAVGVIRKAHGLRGEANVEPWTHSIDRFGELRRVTLVSPDEASTREVEIQGFRPQGDRALVKFGGIETPEDVQQLQNWTVEIPEHEARKPDEDEYFLHDLVGLTLIDADGRERGVVAAAYEGGGGVLLNVRRSDGREYEVPFATDICTEIDLEQKRIRVQLPRGLDELDHVED